MDINKVYLELKEIINEENIRINESLSKHTSFKIGGSADLLVTPENKTQLKQLLMLINKLGIGFFVMGNGSNLLVRDNGIRGVVIKISENMKNATVDNEYMDVEAGILLSSLSTIALKHHLKGLEFACGIPGTLGGAVTMNAGAYGGEIKDVVEEVSIMNYNGDVYVLNNDSLCFGYRKSIVQQKDYIITNVKLRLCNGDYESIKDRIVECSKLRQQKQPITKPSAGSVFKRPVGYYAGKLIQDAGLKGMSIGGAQVSELHSGFIVNTGNATAQDVIKLIEHIKDVVHKKFGVEMESEIKIVGE